MGRRRKTAMRLIATCAVVSGVYATPRPAIAQTTTEQTFIRVLTGTVGQDQPTTSRVVAKGVVNAVGIQRFDPDVEGDESTYHSFVFPRGAISARATPETVSLSIDPRSCVGILTEVATEEIIGGTGDYVGATGSGRLTATGPVTAERNPDGTCDETRLRYVLVIRHTGVLRFAPAG